MFRINFIILEEIKLFLLNFRIFIVQFVLQYYRVFWCDNFNMQIMCVFNAIKPDL